MSLRTSLQRLTRRDPDAPSLRERAASLRAGLARVTRRTEPPADQQREPIVAPPPDAIDWEAWAAHHPGFMPVPADKPTALMALDAAIPQEARRLLDLAEAEFERRRQAYLGYHDATVWPRVAAGLRHKMRMDALAAAAAPDGATDHSEDVEDAAAEGRVLAASGIDHYDGTVSYCGATGRVTREPFRRWVDFSVMQLHAKVQSEIARQRIAANALPNDEYEAWEAKVRRELRADAVFALAFRSDRAFEAAEARRHGIETPTSAGPRRDFSGLGALVSDILDGWTAWNATIGKPETDIEASAAFDRACDWRDELLDAAEALPATPNSLVAKALAIAWLEFVSEDRPSLRRSERSFTGRITLDIHTAIIGAPEAQAPADPDAALIALEAEFLATDAAFMAAARAAGAAWDACSEPPMPRELRVWGNDWIYKVIPRTRIVKRGGACRTDPYGEQEVEQMRGVRCLRRSYGQTGEVQPDGTRAVPDTMAQQRVDAIVTAWDGWREQIRVAKEAVDLPALTAAREQAREIRDAVLQRVRETTASGLAGLAIKARIASSMQTETDIKAAGLKYMDPDDENALLYDLAGDVLALTGGLPAAHGGEG